MLRFAPPCRLGGIEALLIALLLGACASGSSRATLTLHVTGPVARTSRGHCLFHLRARVREGGTQRTCLTAIDGFPAPGATVHSNGLMTFVLTGGTVVLRVRVTQRFGHDGAHARQSLSGVLVRGSGRFAGARGSIAGGGAVVDTRRGLRIDRLSYRVTFSRRAPGSGRG